MNIVKVVHVDYNFEKKGGREYYFKTEFDAGIGDYAVCNTVYGATICIIVSVYKTIEDLFKIKDLPKLDTIKECCAISCIHPLKKEKKKVFDLKTYIEYTRENGVSYENIVRYLLSWAIDCQGLTPEEMNKKGLCYRESWLKEVDE